MRNRGFSLLEVMIVVAIIAILSMIAIPIYSNYTKKARWTDAKIHLPEIRVAEEQYFAEYDKYTTNLGKKGLGIASVNNAASIDYKYYRLNIGSADLNNKFTIKANALDKNKVSIKGLGEKWHFNQDMDEAKAGW